MLGGELDERNMSDGVVRLAVLDALDTEINFSPFCRGVTELLAGYPFYKAVYTSRYANTITISRCW
jgi:hypothetical protein